MSANYEILMLEDQLAFPLYAASREVIKQYNPCLKELDLTYTQYITMLVIWDKQKVSVKELGKTLYLDSGTLTPVLKALESKGLIKRYRSSSDERVLIVELTETGSELRDRAVTVQEEIKHFCKLEPDECKALSQLLYKLLETL